jgi:hypothetical protein
MSDQGLSTQPLQHVPQNLFEAWCISQVSSADSMYARGAKVSIYPQKACPGVNRLSVYIDIDDRQLDDPVVSPRVKASGLAVDHRQ